LNSKFI